MSTDFLQPFAQRMKALRKAAGLTQKQLAERSGVPLYRIVSNEKGKNSRDLQSLDKLADYFCVTTDYLLRGG